MAEPPEADRPRDDADVRPVSDGADVQPPLDSAIDELEALLGEQSGKLDAALRGALPPAAADIPTLEEVVKAVDPAVFPPLTAPAAEAGLDVAEPGPQHDDTENERETVAGTGAEADRPGNAPSTTVSARAAPDPQPAPIADGTDTPVDAGDLRETVRSVVSEELRDVVDSVRTRIMSELGQGAADASPPGAVAPIAPDLNYTSEQTATSPMTDSSDSTAAAAPAAAAPTLDKHYDPHALEREWYERWESSGRFAAAGDDTSYCIVLPPPNITGSLHMGHAFQDTLMDALIRFKRMDGFQTLWQCGTDHAGIATQMVVERQLAKNNLTRHQIGRDRFVDTVWAWKRQSGDTITRQLRRMGASMDWSRERFTLDDGLSAAVHQVFIRLYDEGLIYRGKRLVNWDPKLHTAISDLEVVSAEESGHLWHIRYPLADGSGHVVVATTRPETMLGDTAVAVNPADDRYRRIIGKQIQLPLTERLIPVIADDYVDPEFGSGCVKITPAHDFNDYEVGQRHDLERINIFTIDAVVNENAPPKYQGMDRYAARKQIVADLDDLGLLARVDDHRMMVPRGDRSGVVVEPMLTDQWFVRIQPLADPAIAAVEDGRVRFIPENYAKTYFEWMRNIQDWCISRQLWWGHRIPAWYDEAGNVYVGDDEADARQRNGLADDVPLEQDQDVLDTWFSSALWPFSTLGWPEQTPELKTFYPTSVLVTGFDIIFFWVARMIMMGLKFMGDVPFREVYIHGLVRDGDGNKMSKSKGNVLDPMDLIDGAELGELIEKRTTGLMRPEDAPKIEKTTRRHFPDGIPSYGTDALRFTFAALATLSPDIKFDLGRIEGYRNFCNKIWNAARFILMVTGSESRTDELAVVELGLPERWIKARLDTTVETVRDHFENYRFDLAAQAIYEFIWDEFCDWYLEAAKITLNDEGATPSRKLGTSQTLLTTFETSLRLAHPLIPYITEELWQQIAPLLDIDGDFIMTQRYPLPKSGATDSDAVTEFAFVQDVVRGVRRIRAEYDLDPRKSVPVLASGGSATEQEWLARNLHDILSLARLQRIESVVEGQEPRSATALAGSMKLLVPLADLIDPEAERARLDRELGKLRAELEQAQKKLANESFVSRAPAEVVDKARARVADARSAIAALEEQRARIDTL